MKVVWIIVGAVLVVLILPGILLALSNVATLTFGIGERSLSSTVSYEGGELALPDGVVVEVELIELEPGAPPLRRVVTSKEFEDATALPLAFRLTFQRAEIREGSDYLVEASVRQGATLLYRGTATVEPGESIPDFELVVAAPGPGD